jgi:hypothetical protein
VGLLKPTLPAYDPVAWTRLPFAERARLVCESWAVQGYGSPLGAYVLYALKVALYVYVWRLFTGPVPWLAPIAFEKAILWSMLFEGLGLGCGSGPLTGRYFPPLGGFLYWLRPGTTKLSLLGGKTRTWLDVTLYAALIAFTFRALVAPVITFEMLVPIAVLVPVLGVLDKTIFLALRAEHYWTTIVVLAFARDWIDGAKCVQLALWFFAGFSKLNHHFPSVVGVMISNSPLTRFAWFRRWMYARYPADLRPSRLATLMGHAGTALELSVPVVMLFATPGPSLVLAMLLVLGLHAFITSNVPMGVPIEWNFMVVYGAFALFWAHPHLAPLAPMAIAPWPVAVFLAVMLLALPILGNVFPARISFLLAMRYYAGNWAYSVWLFRGESYRKLAKCKTSAGWVYDQLARFYDKPTGLALVGKVMGFRLMHLHGRALAVLLPKAVDRLEDYEYLDGEIVAGLMLGWNFGDGHLHNEQLLRTLQAQCGFEAGELRCIFVESQPLGRDAMEYRIADAASGEVERGTVLVSELRARQPWEVAAGA